MGKDIVLPVLYTYDLFTDRCTLFDSSGEFIAYGMTCENARLFAAAVNSHEKATVERRGWISSLLGAFGRALAKKKHRPACVHPVDPIPDPPRMFKRAKTTPAQQEYPEGM